MLVVDRRDEYTALSPSYIDRKAVAEADSEEGPGRFRIGDNRAEVDEALRHAVHNMPAPVQLENAEQAAMAHRPPPEGIVCITQTPGADVLLESMLARIWGIAT